MAVRARTLVFGGLVIVFLFLTLSTFAPKKNRETRIVISRVDPTGNYPGADSLPNGNRQSRITINGVIDHGEEQSLAHHSPVELSNDPDDGSSPAPESQHVQLHEDSRGDDQQVEDLDQEAYSGHRSSDVRVPPIAPAHVPGLPQGGHVQGLTLAPSANQRPVREGDFRLLIGVMNPYKSSGRRQIIRSAYSRFSADLPVDIVYISGHTPSWNEDNAYKIRWTHEDAKRWENETFHDLMHLNIQENLEFGKTFEFFKKVGTEYSDKYTHVMKTDDDSFVNLPALVQVLMNLKDEKHFYWGTTWREDWRWPKEMWGSGYILSMDLVRWISTSEIPPTNTWGAEDLKVVEWLIEGGLEDNRFENNSAFAGYPWPELGDGRYKQENDVRPFDRWTLVTHPLKEDFMWIETAEWYLNVEW